MVLITCMVMLTNLFNMMLVHVICPKSMLLGAMVPMHKIKKISLCDSDNYWVIALNNIFGKTFDWVILLNEKDALCSSYMQFGFKEGLSTTECTFTMLETISYYTFNHTNVYALFLDATKAFDKVHYGKHFNELCEQNMSPLVTMLQLYMYTNQRLQVKWGGKISSQFGVLNGTKQDGVLSPILFAVYINSMLDRLKESGIGCYLSNS